eukprot:SM000107S14098  [mRNA]  locus=s107:371554:372423:- [translate_table: standard]
MIINLADRLFLASNTTVDGRGVRVVLQSNGLVVQDATNVILHNLEIGNQVGDPDLVPIRNAQTVWVDHCNIYNAVNGSVDVVKGGTDVTLSNNYIHNFDKTVLLGADDADTFDINLRVTVYRNWFDQDGQRQPLCRFGHCHVANNLYTSWGSYVLGGRDHANIRSDNNIYYAGDARKEVTLYFNGVETTDPNYDPTPTIISFNDLLLNGATFHQFLNGPTFVPPYSLPLYVADYTLETFVKANSGPLF